MGKAQVSVEYLVIVGVAIGLLVPAVLFFYQYSSSSQSSSVSARIHKIGLDMVETARSTYALGKNSRQTLEFTMPEEVTRIYTVGGEIVFSYNTQAGTSEAVFFSSVPLVTTSPDGNISNAHLGLTKYSFTSLGSNVSVAEVVS